MTGVRHFYFEEFLKISIDEQELNDYFKDFGTIISCRIMKDKKTHKSRGFGKKTF